MTPTVLDEKFLPLATRMVNKFGKSLLYQGRGGATFDPATGVASASPDPTALVGVISSADRYRVDGVNVEATDRFVLVAGEAVTPEVGDYLYLGESTDDEKVKIVNIMAIYSGELVAAYEVQVR